jgi:hypothetical protein
LKKLRLLVDPKGHEHEVDDLRYFPWMTYGYGD